MEEVKLILEELSVMGNEGTKKILTKHGAREPFFGVKVADLKKVQKRYKKNHELALALYDTGNSDAMYLAGLISDPSKMDRDLLNNWAKNAYWYMLSEYAVAWTAAESPIALEIALEWTDSQEEQVVAAGWATLTSWLAITPNEQIDYDLIGNLLERIEQNLHQSANRVRYTMNGFVISVGAYIPELTDLAKKVGENIGKVKVDMGGTACKVPDAPSYIQKIMDMGRVGKKKKGAKC